MAGSIPLLLGLREINKPEDQVILPSIESDVSEALPSLDSESIDNSWDIGNEPIFYDLVSMDLGAGLNADDPIGDLDLNIPLQDQDFAF